MDVSEISSYQLFLLIFLLLVPEDATFRKGVEKYAKHRLQILRTEPDWRVCEEKIGHGQLEQLIEDAKDELLLIPMLRTAKPWDVHPDTKVVVELQDVVMVDGTTSNKQ